MFTAEAQSTQRVFFFLLSFDPPKTKADREDGKQKILSLMGNECFGVFEFGSSFLLFYISMLP